MQLKKHLKEIQDAADEFRELGDEVHDDLAKYKDEVKDAKHDLGKAGKHWYHEKKHIQKEWKDAVDYENKNLHFDKSDGTKLGPNIKLDNQE